MTKERPIQIEAAKDAIKAYKQSIGQHDGGLELAIDLLADLRHLLEREGADVDQLFATAESHHQEERECNYSGWTNQETFTVSLWFNNAENSYRYWKEQAAKQRLAAPQRKQVIEGIWSEPSAAKLYLADQMQEDVSEANPLETGSVYSELLVNALRAVEWTEIAQDFIELLEE